MVRKMRLTGKNENGITTQLKDHGRKEGSTIWFVSCLKYLNKCRLRNKQRNNDRIKFDDKNVIYKILFIFAHYLFYIIFVISKSIIIFIFQSEYRR